MVKSQSRKSRQEITGRRPSFRSLKSTHKRVKRYDYDDDLIDHFLNDFLDKGLEIFQEGKGFHEWFIDDIPTESSMVDDEMFGSNSSDIISLDPDVLNNGLAYTDLGGHQILNTQSVTSPEFEIWSPTPDYSGFEAAEYLLNFLTPFEEDDNNINPSLPNREEQ